jgi:hypothetical protein
MPRASETDFTTAVQTFFRNIGTWDWSARLPGVVFIRDFEGLPERSPKDIDLMVPEAIRATFLDMIRAEAEVCDLVCVDWVSPGCCFALILDMDTDRPGRAWAFLEARDSIALGGGTCVRAEDIAIVRSPRLGLPLPADDWLAFLYVVHGLRGGDLAKRRKRLAALGLAAPVARHLVLRYTGIDPEAEDCLSVSSAACQRLQAVMGRSAPVVRRSPQENALNFLRRALKRFRPGRETLPFFTIHGPDGVGKTTTCAEVEHIFSRLPLHFQTLHHVTGWKKSKGPSVAPDGAARRDAATDGASLPRRILKRIYWSAPEVCRRHWVLFTSYRLYLRQLTGVLAEGRRDHRIMLVDRYLYDLVIKQELQGRAMRCLHAVFLFLAHRPKTAFLLTDRPERIVCRKQELTVEEIRFFLVRMPKLAGAHALATLRIDVEGKSPQRVARTVATAVVRALGADIMPLLRKATTGREGD